MDSWVSLVPMQQAPEVTLFPVIDQFIGPYIAYILLVLVLLNMAARLREYGQHESQAEDGADALERNSLRVATNALLVVGSFYYATVSYEAGIVLSTLVIGMVIGDLFEFEARLVEARRGIPIERPKGSIAASVLVLLYVSYKTLFFVIEPIWTSIV